MRYLDPHQFMSKRFTDGTKPDWPVAVICFRGLDGSGTLISRLHAVPLGRKVLYGMDNPGDRPCVYEANICGKSIGLVSGCWWGGPQAAILAEELACLGAKHIIGFGAAGSISRDLPKYAQIVAAKGLVTDGTSRAYTEADCLNADGGLLSTLKSVANTLNLEIIPTTVATVDAIYQETDAAVRGWIGLGAQAINMETAPLYAASQRCGVSSLWLGVVSDCLIGDNWDTWFDMPESIDQSAADITAALVESLLSRRT